MSKFIFVTGGVVSSLGKGITAASLGMLLKSWGLTVRLQKFDPYLNVDPGTMNPYQHGEVYVTDDGAETDLDLGHYERFTGDPTSRDCNWTSGQIYNDVISRERRGDYLGQTIQLIPHVTDEIKKRVHKLAGPDVDVVISEIGGTVGDIEGLPFMEALRQVRLDEGRENTMYVHVSLVPYIRAAQEIKTKPTQHSVVRLREIGIVPDAIICRTERPLTDAVKSKISLFCDVEKRAVIEEPDVDDTIYEVPFIFIDEELDKLIIERLDLDAADEPDLEPWPKILRNIRHPEKEVKVAVVGKYGELQDAYKSIYEAIDHGGIAHHARVECVRVISEDIQEKGADQLLDEVDGILVPGGFGARGVEGKIEATRYARENGIPFLGLCLGMQCAAIEFARNVCGLEGANSTEIDQDTPHPVICLLEEQKDVEKKGASMRLGAQPCELAPESSARKAYEAQEVRERHRHRYEFNNEYREQFSENGMVFSGINPEKDLVEIVEITDHPWFVATQFHPEFRSYPTRPHPLFRDFIRTALEHNTEMGSAE
ncbi:MAG: CTP synthase [Candidatus Brocadiia bacterium]